MKTEPGPDGSSSRCWTVTGIPKEHPLDLTEIVVTVNYPGAGNIDKGMAIDKFIVPLFKLAPRLLEVVYNRTQHDLCTFGLSDNELAEVKRLCAGIAPSQPVPELYFAVDKKPEHTAWGIYARTKADGPSAPFDLLGVGTDYDQTVHRAQRMAFDSPDQHFAVQGGNTFSSFPEQYQV